MPCARSLSKYKSSRAGRKACGGASVSLGRASGSSFKAQASPTVATTPGKNRLRHLSSDHSVELKASSSLAKTSVLAHRIRWQGSANVSSSKVEAVDFLIGSKPRWTEHDAPYWYGSDGDWLVTSFLSPGVQQFAVRVKTTMDRLRSRTTWRASASHRRSRPNSPGPGLSRSAQHVRPSSPELAPSHHTSRLAHPSIPRVAWG
jgi:hypothetical protein